MRFNRLVGAATLSIIFAAVGHWIVEEPVSAQGTLVQGTLSFFKNYFVTGDYVVRGTSLWRKGVNGKAVVNIPRLGGPDGVPANADILAAFLYVQTSEKIRGSGINNARFNNISLGPFTAPGSNEPGSGTYAVPLPSWDQAMAPCWSTAFPPVRRLITYRVDVFRFLPIDPATGKQDLNRTHRLEVPDSGTLFGEDDESGNEPPNLNGPRAIGASVVVVYRDPTKPYRGIVIHDGAFTKRAFQTMTQSVNGWYQASTGAPKSASLTQVVGDGRLFLSERVLLNGQLISTNPFRSADGPKWDNFRTNITLPNGASSASLRIEPHTVLSDCTHQSAWIVGTTVQDTDADGLLDIWETNNNGLGLTDPTGLALPDISSMADPRHKNMFVEVAYMHAKEGTTYGGVPKPQHSHKPRLEALTLVGETLKNAPVSNPDGINGIDVHFDVGNDYQFSPPNPYIVPAQFARGGKNMSETALCPNPANPINGPPVECVLPNGAQGPIPGQYPQFPGTVGYMTGLRFVQELLGFDRNRKDIYRYGFFGHFLGLPVEPCQLPDGPDPDTEPDGNDENCQLTNPNFHVPRTNSGIAEYPGKHFMVMLGGFDDEEGRPIGTLFMQASTIFHEFGHGVELTHAGPRQNPRLENCLPFYFSSMNYAYQLRGLLDGNAVKRLGFTSVPVEGLNETLLSDGSPYGLLPFRLGFYAPWTESYAKFLGNPATKHCDGSELSQAEKDAIANGGGMVRVDANSLLGTEVDWDADGTPEGGLPAQDLNFNGLVGNLGQGLSDWPFVARRLNQLGAGRNVGGLYIDALGKRNMGPLSLDVGRGDIGRGDIGRGDIGRGDIGRGDIGRGDIGRGDIGRGDIGRGDIGRGDIGRGDIGKGDTDVGGSANEPFGEIDLETAEAMSGDAPPPSSGLAACLTDDGECVEEAGDIPVRLDWESPSFGRVVRYFVYRFDVNPDLPFPPADLPTEEIGTVEPPVEGSIATAFVDESAEGGSSYAYFVIAEFPDDDDPDELPEFSGISNFARISTPGETLPLPSPPEPLSPTDNVAIAQNDPATGCDPLPGANASRGRGFQILFDWTDAESPLEISGYRISATKVGAAQPILDNVFVEGSGYTLRSCNAFVADENLEGWQWTVRTVDVEGQMSEPSTPGTFQFAPCRLETGAPCSAPAGSGVGSVQDPLGDSVQSGSTPDRPDFTTSTVSIADGSIRLSATFGAESFTTETLVQFVLDTDENPATGSPGVDSNCTNDAATMGTDFFVEVRGRSFDQPGIRVGRALGGCNSYSVTVTEGNVSFRPNGLDITIPLSAIGSDDGQLRFKVLAATQLGPGTFTGVQDYMTDVGLAPGTVRP